MQTHPQQPTAALASILTDLAPFLRAGYYAAGELGLHPNGHAAVTAASDVLARWSRGDSPTEEEAAWLLALARAQASRWERVELAALGVVVRLRGAAQGGR